MLESTFELHNNIDIGGIYVAFENLFHFAGRTMY